MVVSVGIWVDPVVGHEFEDGFVDRSVKVTIRDRMLTIEYSVGCNPITMQERLAHWTMEQAPVSSDAGKESETPQAIPSGERELAELEARFQAELLTQLEQRLSIRCDDRAMSLTPVSVASSPRHHVNAVATLQLELPDGNPLSLLIQDPLFDPLAGEARFAAKSFGDAMLARSNVPPTLTRAKRLKLSALTTEQRLDKTKIECQLVFVSTQDGNR